MKLNCKRGELDTMEVKEKVFKCGNHWCGKVFTKNFNLSRHVQNCHQKLKKNFSCTRCSNSFFKESKLRRHMKSHEIKPLYCCDNCSNIYIREDKFDVHKMNCKGVVESNDDTYLSMVNLHLYSNTDTNNNKENESNSGFFDDIFDSQLLYANYCDASNIQSTPVPVNDPDFAISTNDKPINNMLDDNEDVDNVHLPQCDDFVSDENVGESLPISGDSDKTDSHDADSQEISPLLYKLQIADYTMMHLKKLRNLGK